MSFECYGLIVSTPLSMGPAGIRKETSRFDHGGLETMPGFAPLIRANSNSAAGN